MVRDWAIGLRATHDKSTGPLVGELFMVRHWAISLRATHDKSTGPLVGEVFLSIRSSVGGDANVRRQGQMM